MLGAFCLSCGSAEPPADPEAARGAEPERETIRVEHAGGQTGMEGTCLAVPEPEEFSGEEVRALLEGERASTLAFRPALRSIEEPDGDVDGIPMTVIVESQGEARVRNGDWGESCGLVIQQDVVVTLRFNEPALDIIIEGTADAFSRTFAVLQREVGADVAEALGLPPLGYTLSIAFESDGPHGTFEAGDYCGLTVFPARTHCPEWNEVEVALDRDRDGFRPRDALSALGEMSNLPLRWDDGTETTLSVTVVEGPEWACSGSWVETYCPENLYMPMSVRVTTGDGRIDSEMPAQLSLSVTTEASAGFDGCGLGETPGQIEDLGLFVEGVVPDAALGDGLIAPDTNSVSLEVNVWKSPATGTHTELRLYRAELHEAALAPPIDATVNAAGASCVSYAGDPIATAATPEP